MQHEWTLLVPKLPFAAAMRQGCLVEQNADHQGQKPCSRDRAQQPSCIGDTRFDLNFRSLEIVWFRFHDRPTVCCLCTDTMRLRPIGSGEDRVGGLAPLNCAARASCWQRHQEEAGLNHAGVDE